MERRLAAILVVDVVGYSRLMERDESGTFARLRAHRKELFEPEIAAHNGRVFKLTGDGLLAEFASVVDAVECAVTLQRGLTERNGAAPAEHRIEARIGVNLGDVIVEKDEGGAVDMHGEGVIIANRLQALAEPGGICVSQTVVNHVRNKVALGFEFVGEQRVKNVAEPVKAYRMLTGPAITGKAAGSRRKPWLKWRWPAAAAGLAIVIAAGVIAWQRPWEPTIQAAAVERMALPLPDKPSIVVLPFANMSGDPQQDYFADGLTEDLTTDLSRLADLFVISRNTAFTYKGKAVKPAEVAEELGVRYLLEGSVRRDEDEVRINAQLIDALSGGHVWADRYDGSLADIFALQDKVTNAIVDALALRLTDVEQRAVNQQETRVPAAYEALLRGWEHYRRTTAEDYAKAIPFFEEAVRLDPEYGRAYAALAMVYARSNARDYAFALGLTNYEAKQKAKAYLEQARKHPTAAFHQVAGYLEMTAQASQAAIDEFKEAIAQDPSDSWSYLFMGVALTSAGRPAEGLPHVRTALRLDPRPPSIFLYYLGLVQFALEQYTDAAGSVEEAIALNPEDDFSYVLLGASYGYLGRTDDAKAAIARHNELKVKRGFIPLTVAWAPNLWFYRSSDLNRLKKGLRLAGVPEFLVSSKFIKQNGVSAEEIRSLFFGHKLHGRNLYNGQRHAATITADGRATLSGDWGSFSDAGVEFDGYQLCYVLSADVKLCGTVVRNEGGTLATENEFIWFDTRDVFTFSVVE